MGKSARVLGWEFGRTAREMNGLLKDHGYLHGDPGAYGLTEKGKQYADEHHHTNGVGGYAQYQVNYETRTWNDGTAAALKADIEANPEGLADADPSADEEDSFEYDSYEESDDDDSPQLGWAGLAVVGAIVGGVLIAPHVKPFWNDKAKPAAKRLRARLSTRESVESD